VATDVRALRETLSHERTGLLIPPDDPRALLSALRRLHDDAALRATLRRGVDEHIRSLDAARAGHVARRRYEALLL
jgi:glycosyltransferase involved in cell wall biosynthesis